MGKTDFPEQAIFICDGKKCGKYSEIKKYCKDAIKNNGLKKEVELVKMGCVDRCKQAPVVCFQPANAWFTEVTEEEIAQLFSRFVRNE